MVLGKHLKGAFKAVMMAIKQLSSEELEQFQKSGNVVVEGHELHEEDSCLMYTFDQATGGTAQFEAHSDAQALVLLDITPDQSMVDEGMAWEVINRIQKLRSIPTDKITVYYNAKSEGRYLNNVFESHTDFIFAIIKPPLKPYPVPVSGNILIQEQTQLKGSELEITLTKGLRVPGPACAYVNLNICVNGTEQSGVLLLENPKGDNKLNLLKLKIIVTSIFSVKNVELSVFHGETELQNQTGLLSLSGKTLRLTAGTYINLQLLNAEPQECLVGTVGTLLLENPLGQNALTQQGLMYEAAKVFGLRSRKLKPFLNETQTHELTEDIPMKTLNTKIVLVLPQRHKAHF
uniref:Isoleucine--tRNA ligase cytoplasmic ubiquitin-like domain-containing protein n=1 Tax=Nannospalax galili TaxID=1026970 RepID=A0A8C6RPB1_NANGA